MDQPEIRTETVVEPVIQRLPVHAAVMQLLRDLGITTLFGNPGSTELGMFRDFPKDFSYQLGLHEGVVVGMADGFAQATRHAAVVNLHSAAGVGNAMGALFTAYRNQTPLLVIAGQQSRSLLPFDPYLFSGQATELPKPYVKWAVEPARAEDVPQALARAYYLAMQPPRGPVLVSVPADDWGRLCDPVQVRRVGTTVRPDRGVLAEIAGQLTRARRPAFVVGAAVDREGAWPLVQALAERHRAAVWNAPMSGRNGFPEDHPQFCGFLPASREQIVGALTPYDFILVLGAPAFTYHVEGQGPHIPPGSTLAQITDDPNLLAWSPAGTAVVGSLCDSVQELLEAPVPAARSLPAGRSVPARPEASRPMTTAFVLDALAALRPRDSIIVEEAPSARRIMHQYLPILEPQTFYTMCSGGLGFGVPAAVGVALGRPGEKVIAVLGDGSSLYSIQALWNAVRLNLPVAFLILKNRTYAALKKFGPVYGFSEGESLPGTELGDIDFVSIAQGFGCEAVRVSDPESLVPQIRRALSKTAPMLVEIEVA